MITNNACCPLTACPKSGICVHYANNVKAQEDESFEVLNTRFITPTADGCPHLIVEKTERWAYGFVKMLDTMPIGKARAFNGYGFFGSQPTYSRAKNGIRAITPEEQEVLLEMFQRYGADVSLGFDRYKDVVVVSKP
ncbi:MAG: hypothetical protein KBT29_08575 [Prevotellaceae bacterium]|nr:hypothetical protein [Candidatus Minthosoma caballi]